MFMQSINMQPDCQRRAQLQATDWRSVAERTFPRASLVERRRFVMEAALVDMVRLGRKRSTIRFDEQGVEYPASDVIPVYSVEPGGARTSARRAMSVRVESVGYLSCRNLSDVDALQDGFQNRAELIGALEAFYPTLKPDSLVVIYRFGPTALP